MRKIIFPIFFFFLGENKRDIILRVNQFMTVVLNSVKAIKFSTIGTGSSKEIKKTSIKIGFKFCMGICTLIVYDMLLACV